MGLGYELDAIAATVIGGTSLTGGIGRIWGTVIGMVILGLMTSGFTFLGVDGVLSGHRQGRDDRRGRCRRHVSPAQAQEGLNVAKQSTRNALRRAHSQ
jgi:hypothetical protein